MASTSGAAKRCSGEFKFIVNGNGGHEAVHPHMGGGGGGGEDKAEPPVQMRKQRRPVGLGRRAATQIEIEQRKKNSYNAAMYKSQENLVKVSSFLLLRQLGIGSVERLPLPCMN